MMKNSCGRIAVMTALVMALLIPASALAESAQTEDRGPTLSLGCGFGVDESAMTAEQQAARVAAVNQYYAAEDEVLAGLVQAGTAAQADVDGYQIGRDARWLLTQMDKSAWSEEQVEAYRQAASLSGAERDAAADALVAAGQLTAEQGEALKASATNTSRSIELNDAAAATTAKSSLDALRQTLRQTLADAGIAASEADTSGSKARKDKRGTQSDTSLTSA